MARRLWLKLNFNNGTEHAPHDITVTNTMFAGGAPIRFSKLLSIPSSTHNILSLSNALTVSILSAPGRHVMM
jgi:hypothetical protein